MADKQVFVIVGFDAAGNAVEVTNCEPDNVLAEAYIKAYGGELVNLHYLPRTVDDSVQSQAPALATVPGAQVPEPEAKAEAEDWPSESRSSRRQFYKR